MKRVLKSADSEIVSNNLEYIVDGNNSLLSQLLFKEQKGFCAYTETYLGRTDKKEIDHFNPKKDFADRNRYNNLFLVKGQWNSEKSDKWDNFQPVMHPTDENFEIRIVYSEGDYLLADSEDVAAKNLIELIKLDDADLAAERKKYIARKKSDIEAYGSSIFDFFQLLVQSDINSIKFLRAIEEEFGIDVKAML